MIVSIDEIVRNGKGYTRKHIGDFNLDDAGKSLLDYATLIIDHDVTQKSRTVRIQAIRPITIAVVNGKAIGALVDVVGDEVWQAIDYPQRRVYQDWARENKVWEPTR